MPTSSTGCWAASRLPNTLRMSYERSAPVLDLGLGASRTLSVGVAASGLLSSAVVFASDWPVPVECLAAAAVIVASVRWLYVEGLRLAPSAIVRLVLLEDDESMIVERGGTQRGVRLGRGVVVTSSLALVTLRPGRWRSRTLCIAADAVDRDAFRRLRTRVLLQAGARGRAPRRFGFGPRRSAPEDDTRG